MALTTKEIYDLNNSMVAAQNVELGTVLDALITSSGSSGAKVVSGSFVPATATTPVVTGLTSMTGFVVSMAGTPTTRHVWTTGASGSVAGVIWVSCWEGGASASVVTVIASTGSATAHFAQVNWMAQGA
jgi:hypothetical protein